MATSMGRWSAGGVPPGSLVTVVSEQNAYRDGAEEKQDIWSVSLYNSLFAAQGRERVPPVRPPPYERTRERAIGRPAGRPADQPVNR